ncbi:MAG: hypothetical protein JWO71_2836, partial [Candidatus Acidoferrum typicum]|nr:hypothetical protein [Candidatus Acidoferrum typicum]
LTATILVIVASFAVIAPMLVLGTMAGRDFPFHLASWMDVARQWHEGTIYPQWAELANWGFGEPRFVFYPPGSWMLGAALGSLLPWKAVPLFFVWLVLIGAGRSMFLLARESMPRQQAALAAMLFAANPYHLLLVYYRSDFAELLASAFFPLLPWGVMRIARGGWRAVPALASVVAFIWLSNAPAAVIAVYSLVLLCVVAYAVRRELPFLLYGSLALAGGFGLAAFYILPAAHQRAWVQINRVLTDGLRPEQNFLFSRSTSMAVNTDFNLKISCVVLLMGVLIAVAAVHLAKSAAIPRLHYWLLLALGAISFFMMFRFSLPLWELAPELHFVQFPWRYAVPLGVAFAFFLGAGAGKFRGLSILAICLFILGGPLAKIMLAINRPSSWRKAEISRFQRSIDNGKGYRGMPEYLPNGAKSEVSEESAAARQGSDFDEFAITNGNTFRVQATVPREIAFNLFDYPTWQVDVDGSRVNPKGKDSDGRLVVAVPAGNHLIHIFLQRKWDAKLGIAISLATAILLLCLTFLAWRPNELSDQLDSKSARSFSAATVEAPALSMGSNEHS